VAVHNREDQAPDVTANLPVPTSRLADFSTCEDPGAKLLVVQPPED
jgi:hypothetical protein